MCRKQVFEHVCTGSRARIKDCEWYSKSCDRFTELFISTTNVDVPDVPGDGGEPGRGVMLRIHREVSYIIQNYHQTSGFSFIFSILFNKTFLAFS